MSNWPTPPGSFDSNNPLGLIAQRYRLLDSIGEGSMGKVYQALDTKFVPPREVAIKILHPDLVVDPLVREALRKEAGITARFNHPNILRVLDFEVELDNAYIVTDRASGGSLEDKIYPDKTKGGRALSLHDVGRYLDQITSALEEAHQAGLVHRDIKPQNILLDKHNKILLADFGLALDASASGKKLVKLEEAWGTPDYAAPEIWDGKAGRASDIYAVGVLLYEMLTGHVPYNANENVQTSLENLHKNAGIPSLNKYIPKTAYPEELDKLLKRCMAKDPAKRPKTARDVYNSYNSIINNFNPVVAKPQIAVPPKKNAQKAANALVNFLVGLLVIGCSIGFFTSLGSPSKSSSRPTSTPRSTATLAAIRATPTPDALTPATLSAGTTPANAPLTLSGHTSNIWTVAWSPDSKLLATGSDDFSVRLWRPDGTTVRTLPLNGRVEVLKWSPDGKTLATATSKGTVQIWDATGENLLQTLNWHKSTVVALAWSPDSKTLASAGRDSSKENKVVLWNSENNQITQLPTSYDEPVSNALVWSPDSQKIGVGTESNKPFFWTLTGADLPPFEGHSGAINSLAWSPDGKLLATGGKDRMLYIWTAEGRQVAKTNYGAEISWVAWSPKGNLLATTARDGTLRLLNPDGKVVTTLKAHSDEARNVVWSPSGATLATVGKDGLVRVFVSNGTLIYTIANQSKISSQIAWSPNGLYLATIAPDNSLKLWLLGLP